MAKLSPVYIDAQFIAGVPANGALVFTYVAGSTTKLTTYADASGVTPNPNPVVLNARGEPPQPFWLTEGQAYKFVFSPSTDSDPPTNPIRTIDNVTGVGDNTITLSQWQSVGVSPTYVNANQFTLAGDQLSVFTTGRRVKALVTAGTVYGTITSASYNGSLTTVTVSLDSGALDSGLSSVQLGIITPEDTSLTANIDTTFVVLDNADKTKAFKLEVSGVTTATTRTATVPDKNGTFAYLDDITTAINNLRTSLPLLQVRQTVYSGPVDTNGWASFGGATGSTTVTASGTLLVTAANGFTTGGDLDRNGGITNPSWTGLSVNGTMYLYLDVNADGTCTPGASNLAPTYRNGGNDVITNNVFTFNITQKVGKLGNGTVANQAYRVYVGDVTVAGGVVTAISWYAINGKYISDLIAYTASGSYTRSHNLGGSDELMSVRVSANGGSGWTAQAVAFGGSYTYPGETHTNKAVTMVISTGIMISGTSFANGSLRIFVDRGW